MSRIGRVQSSTGIYHVMLHGASSTCEYDYDCNGALTRDGNRGINNITYDYGHHPQRISMSTRNRVSTIGRTNNILNDYTPDGRKLSSVHTTSSIKGRTIKETSRDTDMYIDGLILHNGKPHMWQFDGGYVELDDNGTPTSWNYYITDHLGSTRKVVDSNNNVLETINYYPFGSEMKMQEPSVIIRPRAMMASSIGGWTASDSLMSASVGREIGIKDSLQYRPIDGEIGIEKPIQKENDFWHPYRFSGKELDKQNGLNMYDFGARLFDVAGVPMWTSVDPLAEKYYNVTPYSYCAGNPVNKFDPDGREVIDRLPAQNQKQKISKQNFFNQWHDNKNSIILMGHGGDDGKSFCTNDAIDKIYANSPYGIVSYLEDNSKTWNISSIASDKVELVLFSCDTGTYKGLAENLSKQNDFQNISIFAPSEPININPDGSVSIDNDGVWREYLNGKVVNEYSGNTVPGTQEFNSSTTWEKKPQQINWQK